MIRSYARDGAHEWRKNYIKISKFGNTGTMKKERSYCYEKLKQTVDGERTT